MSSKRILPLIVIVIALVLMTIFIVRILKNGKYSLIEEYGGWISIREPYKSNRFDYYNTLKT